jgi:hypothetical protein
MRRGELRVYPAACTAAFCGRLTCPTGCSALPQLEAFKAWRERTNAEQPDPIWTPTVYRAQRVGRGLSLGRISSRPESGSEGVLG